MTPDDSSLSHHLAAAARILWGGQAPPAAFPVFVTFARSCGDRAEVVLGRDAVLGVTRELPLPPAAPTAGPVPRAAQLVFAPPARARTIHVKIYRKATDQPQPAKKLIKDAGYDAESSYSRAAVAALVREGYLRRTADGLVLGPRGREAPASDAG